MKIIAGETAPSPDPMARAHRWAKALRVGTPLYELARREQVSPSYLRQRAKLAFLSPALQTAILEGRQPIGMTTKALIRKGIPLDWKAQEELLR